LDKVKVGFIGGGRVGTALAILLSGKGYPVVAAASRTRSSAENLAGQVAGCTVYDQQQDVTDHAELVFITTSDDAIAQVAAQLKWHPGQGVAHCSGAASTDILEPARKADAVVGSMHPLQTIADSKQGVENIPGSTFGVEAEEPLKSTLRAMVADLGGRFIELKASDKVAYHAAAVIACNYLVTLEKMATDLWQTFDVPRDQAIHALLPLVQGTLNNLDRIGIPDCLTGPIARGDTGTINKHLKKLKETAPSLLFAYRELGLQTIPISAAKGKIDEKQAEELRKILKHEGDSQ
jgi:predicted short-subunit dehydrogenase-like oxidoreductase (DUF2520 family)